MRSLSTLSPEQWDELEFDLADMDVDWNALRLNKNLFLPANNIFMFGSEPHVELLRLIRDPANFYFTCKYILNVELLPIQIVTLQEMWNHTYPMLVATRGYGKTFLLAVYCILYNLIRQGSKVVVTGAGFRQSKLVFEYIERIWRNAPVLRNLVDYDGGSGPKKSPDVWKFVIGDSQTSCLPVGTGEKIRGQRANCIIAEEFSSLNEEIYEQVISGFASVSASPVENVKMYARVQKLKQRGQWTREQQAQYEMGVKSNQSIISGTADYAFKHFAKYWRRYKAIIESRGEESKIREIFGGEMPNSSFNHRDYCIIRVPYDILQETYMDAKNIAKSQATVHSAIFMMEYGAVFPSDSDGFFRRSLIESCVTKDNTVLIDGRPINFKAVTMGNQSLKYVFAIDPAAEADKFSIVVLEIHDTHRRVVYVWTTDKEEHGKKFKAGLVEDNDFYAYTARKVRNLMKLFPCEHIALDSQGGGGAVLEALHNKHNLKQGELPIWRINADHPLSDGKERDSDNEVGLHIVEMVNFASADYTNEANHGLKKDMEDKVLLFPYLDAIDLELAAAKDNQNQIRYDGLEDCVWEIEQLKDELATIVHTATATGRDHWDTPEIKLANSKKGRMRKDRYSSLLMANSAARRLHFAPETFVYQATGGFAGQMKRDTTQPMYIGPSWFTQQMGSYGHSVSRSR